MKIAIWLVNINCDSLKLTGSTHTSRSTHLSRRSAIAFSLDNNKISFSSTMDQVFLFAFNGELVVIERRKNKAKRQENENALYL